jgi:hypothetical protein
MPEYYTDDPVVDLDDYYEWEEDHPDHDDLEDDDPENARMRAQWCDAHNVYLCEDH